MPKMDFGLQARLEKEERIRLDGEQFAVLQELMENKSVLVTGAAGTGKTALALTLARKLAESGKKVLVLCFTKPLARWMRAQIGQPNPAVWAIKRYAVEILRQAGRDVVVEDTSQFWSGVALEAVVEALPALDPGWDAVVVDEGQDLTDDDWMLIEELSRGKLCWAFRDPGQLFWPDRRIQDRLFQTRYQLQQKYRCAAPVLQLAPCYLSEKPEAKTLRNSLNPEIVAVRACPGPGTVLERIASEIDKLKGSGLAAADIAVLALDKQDYRTRTFIALTRALSTVRIIDTRDALATDPILCRFC